MFWGYLGRYGIYGGTEKKVDTTIWGLGLGLRYITPTMENYMERRLELS